MSLRIPEHETSLSGTDPRQGGTDPRARDWGLYRSAYERDSCGFGLIASLDDQASHWVLQTAISSLNRLTHRGAIAADGKTGDGCGLLIKAPARFLRAAAAEARISLGLQFAAGLVFLNRDEPKAAEARRVVTEQIEREKMSVAGFRVMPVDPSACGLEALKTLPHIEQVFVNSSPDIDEATFNRQLYMARRRAEKILESIDPGFYIPSLSASTIVYKGMVMPQHLAQFYPDLKDPRMEASVVVFHQRFSTNTLPQWRLAHPYRYLAHNGEINTVQGNRSWAVARGPLFRSPLLPDLGDVLPVVSLTGSDSQSLDNMLELLLVGGLDPMHAMRMLVPPAWQSVDMIDPDLKAFYEYYATHMEPWDGPAGIVLTDGRYACCTLDRNGLRPARWVITKNRHITVASEAGVWDYLPEDVVRKGKLGPGEILALDLQTSELMDTRQVDDLLKSRHPYKVWLKKGVRYLQTDLIDPRLAAEPFDRDTLALFQKMFNVSVEERDEIIRVLAEDESEAVGSMGDDTPMPVLSKKVRSLYDYFRQQFAQVTNPPIDSLRESIVMSLQTQIGPECNIFVPAPQHAEQIVLSSPILSQRKLRQIMGLEDSGVPHEFVDLQYPAEMDLKTAILKVCDQAEAAVRAGKLVLLLSDRYPVKGKIPVHALLATGAVHHRLVRTGLRCKCNILVETGTARDAHHFACLIGYGATAVYPYLAYQTLFDLMRKGALKMDADTRQELGRSYRRGIRKGLFKIMSKMGISTIASYRSAQLFEIVGLSDEVVSLCFEGSESRIAGCGLRRPEGRCGVFVSPGVGSDGKRESRRLAQVHARRRVPHVQPGRDRSAAVGRDDRRLRAVPAVRRAGQRAPRFLHPRSVETRSPRAAIPIDEVEPVADDPRALRRRRHVPGCAVAGGARGAGDRHEPPGRALELRRGRRGSAALRHREEFQDQAGRLRPLRRDARVPDQCRGAADQDRAGREAGRGRAAAGTQGERDDRAPAFRASRRRLHFPAAAPRHLFDRGSRAADLRLEAGQSAGAGLGQAGGRARRRHGGGRSRQGLRRPHHHLAATTAAPARARCPRSSTPAPRGNWGWPRPIRRCARTSCAIGCGCRRTAA